MKQYLTVKNTFNDYPLKSFGKKEIVLFLYLCLEVSYQKKEILQIKYDVFCDSSYDTKKKIRTQLVRLEKKFKEETFITEHSSNPLFYNFHFEYDFFTCSAQSELVTNLTNVNTNYTQLDLLEISSLKSSYAIKLYRKIKQFQSNGWYKSEIANFKKIMGIPDKYKTYQMIELIVKPSVSELKEIFPALCFNLEKERKRGAPIKNIRFSWKTSGYHKSAEKPKNESIQKIITKRSFSLSAHRYLDYPQRKYSPEELNRLEEELLNPAPNPKKN